MDDETQFGIVFSSWVVGLLTGIVGIIGVCADPTAVWPFILLAVWTVNSLIAVGCSRFVLGREEYWSEDVAEDPTCFESRGMRIGISLTGWLPAFVATALVDFLLAQGLQWLGHILGRLGQLPHTLRLWLARKEIKVRHRLFGWWLNRRRMKLPDVKLLHRLEKQIADLQRLARNCQWQLEIYTNGALPNAAAAHQRAKKELQQTMMIIERLLRDRGDLLRELANSEAFPEFPLAVQADLLQTRAEELAIKVEDYLRASEEVERELNSQSHAL